MNALLVSRELSPFFGGGIGVYTVAMAEALSGAGHEVHILTGPHEGLAPGTRAGGACVHTVDAERGRAALDAYPAWPMRYAMAVLEALERLTAEHRLDYIEFPDYHAEGYFAIRAKRTLGRFAGSVLAVRLHSASWLCLHADRESRLDPELACVEHLERTALAEADLVVSPGARVLARIDEGGGAMRAIEHRARRAVIPIPVDVVRTRRALGDGEEPTSAVPEVLFFGKLQHLKGPHDLVAAAVALLDRGVRARFRFIGNDSPTGPFGRSMLEFLRSRIPGRHAPSFVFEPARPRARLGAAIRAAGASGGVCCFPSRWEAFPMACLEAMSLGAPVVAADAGGLGEIIEDGVSGLLAPPGDAPALAAALARALGDAGLRARLAGAAPRRVGELCDPARVVGSLEQEVRGLNAGGVRSQESSAGSPVTVSAPAAPLSSSALNGPVPAVSVVISHYNLGRYLPQAIESVRRQTWRDLEILVVDDGSTDPESIAILDRLGPGVRLVRKPNGGLPSTRNRGLEEARAPWVLPLDADDLIDPTLVEKLLSVVRDHPELDYVSPLVLYFEDDPARPTGGWAPLGPDRDLLLVRNVGGAASGSLIRREAALGVGGYDPWMTSYEDWEFWCRLAGAGRCGTVIPEFLLFYRVRPDSMFRTEAVARHAALRAYILERHWAMAASPSRVMRILQSLADADPRASARAIIAENIRYRVVDTINDALKRAGVQRALKGLTSRVLRAGRSPRP